MAVVWRCLLFVSLVLTKFVSASVTNAIPQTEDKEAAVDYVPLHQSSPCEPCPAQPSAQGCKKEYLLVNELSSWYEAMAGCKMRGQQLVTINNIEQWNQVQREITLKKPDYLTNAYWTAGMSINSGSFVWASTWEPFNFTSWRDGEPGFQGKINCVAIGWLHKHKYDWIQRNCNYGKSFICEKCSNQ
ncbi:ladderlectin-like isoform X2 [Homalodisca vitripennis]|uniref:ladderlectin-like isoform X2 n=1 Tax=Homalodisca vitripennis TaxID=197043 RepID=UPI001EEC587F|nr:ladderlectin-like isoform X2 [Homalodisca vitripennis]